MLGRLSQESAFKNILLHVSNHALKYVHAELWNFEKSSFYYSSVRVLIDFINSVIAIHVFYEQVHCLLHPRILIWLHKFSVWKLPCSCLLNPLSACDWFIISVSWSIKFQMVFRFYISLSSVYLFSIQQLRALFAEM